MNQDDLYQALTRRRGSKGRNLNAEQLSHQLHVYTAEQPEDFKSNLKRHQKEKEHVKTVSDVAAKIARKVFKAETLLQEEGFAQAPKVTRQARLKENQQLLHAYEVGVQARMKGVQGPETQFDRAWTQLESNLAKVRMGETAEEQQKYLQKARQLFLEADILMRPHSAAEAGARRDRDRDDEKDELRANEARASPRPQPPPQGSEDDNSDEQWV
jgi:hypothetical protein